MRWRKSAGLDVAGELAGAVAVVDVDSLPPAASPAAKRACARVTGAINIAIPIANIPARTPKVFFIK
jgi:hypothetical protein